MQAVPSPPSILPLSVLLSLPVPPPYFLHSCLPLPPSLRLHPPPFFIPQNYTFQWSLTKGEPPRFLTDKSALVAAQLVNQGALHAQWDKVNDRKVKRGRGGDLPSQVAGYVMLGGMCWVNPWTGKDVQKYCTTGTTTSPLTTHLSGYLPCEAFFKSTNE